MINLPPIRPRFDNPPKESGIWGDIAKDFLSAFAATLGYEFAKGISGCIFFQTIEEDIDEDEECEEE